MYRYLIIFDQVVFHFFLNKDKGDDFRSLLMEFRTDGPSNLILNISLYSEIFSVSKIK